MKRSALVLRYALSELGIRTQDLGALRAAARDSRELHTSRVNVYPAALVTSMRVDAIADRIEAALMSNGPDS